MVELQSGQIIYASAAIDDAARSTAIEWAEANNYGPHNANLAIYDGLLCIILK